MNFTLHQLQVFLKISQTKSITKAAFELHLTQPAVSIQLKNFQEQFEIPLTEVIARRLYVTDFGKEIAKAAENILDEVHAVNYKTLAYKGKLTGRLKLSVVSTGKYVMPFFLQKFITDNQGVELLMDVTNKAIVMKSLEQNEVDFALVSVMPDKLNIENLELIQNKLFLVGNQQKQFKTLPYEKSILETLPLIFRESGSGTRQMMEKFIALNNIPINKKMELTSNEAVKQAVIAGLGYSIMPLIGIKTELQNGTLQIIPVTGLPIKTTWNLIWLKGKNFSPAAASFLDFLKKEKDNIKAAHFNWFESY
jgi:DNA-binding transcriptional LysR family regulator